MGKDGSVAKRLAAFALMMDPCGGTGALASIAIICVLSMRSPTLIGFWFGCLRSVTERAIATEEVSLKFAEYCN
jgi:hypothetical protein